MKNVEKDFLGDIFSYNTEIDEHGYALWTPQIDVEFSKWLHELKSKNRELFKVQYSHSSNAGKILEKIQDLVGVYEDSLIVRAITITFISIIDTKKGKNVIDRLSHYKNLEELEVLMQGHLHKKSLYFSPSGMRVLEAYSKLTGLKKSKVVQNALYSVFLLSINEDDQIKKFWNEEILAKLKQMARAAA